MQGGSSLAIQWLKLHACNAGGTGLIFGQGTKIPQAATWPKIFFFLMQCMIWTG